MTSPGDDDLPAELALVRNAIVRELRAQLPLRGEKLGIADVPGVAYMLAVQLGREFRIEYDPARLGEPDDDESDLDSAVFHGSALPPERYPVFDRAWPRR